MAALTNVLIPAFTETRDGHRSETDGRRLERHKPRITLTASHGTSHLSSSKRRNFPTDRLMVIAEQMLDTGRCQPIDADRSWDCSVILEQICAFNVLGTVNTERVGKWGKVW